MYAIRQILTTPLVVVQDSALTLVDILITVGIFLLFYGLARLMSQQLQRNVWPRIGIKGSNRRILNSVTSFFVLLAGVYTSLSFLGINLSVLLVPLGAVSIGLGLGLQTLASNYVAGVVLLVEKTIRDGDLIEVDGITGTVVETGLRATVVRTFNNTEVILPNSVLISQRLENWTKTDRVIRVDAYIGVAYGTDIPTVHGILQDQIMNHEAVLAEPAPCTFLTDFADSAVMFRILYWIGDPATRLSSLSEILEGIYREFDRHSIEIPFPQRDVWLKSAEEPGTG